MMEHDFLEYAGTLTTKEIDDIISKLNQVKESRADEARRVAAKKVKDAIDEYLKIEDIISVSGGAWSDKYDQYENVDATFDNCEYDDDGRLTFFVE